MTEIQATPTQLVMYRRIIRDGQTGDESVMYEGEIPLADQQQVDLKALIGDGLAKVTASREISEKDYGNGGSIHLSVTITCDQSEAIIESAATWVGHLASKYATEQHASLRSQLMSLGLIK